MPFYDGIGVIAEKHAVVLDVGTALTKVGYAGESVPRAIVRTPKFEGLDNDHLEEAAVSFIHRLYFEHLLVNPKDRRVVLVEGLLGDVRFRNCLVKVLFTHFEVLSVLLAPSHLMPLFGLGLEHAIVLDMGFKEATVIPVYQSVPILKAWQALPLGSLAVHRAIKEDLIARGTAKVGDGDYVKVSDLGLEVDEEVLEDIKVRLCFATEMSRGLQIQEIKSDASQVSGLSSFLKKSVPDASYPLVGDVVLRVDGQARESACEVLFEMDGDRTSISSIILDSLLKCPRDTRKELAANIVIVGGTSMIPGFKNRLFQEMRHLLSKEPYASSLSITDLKIHAPPGIANYSCWLGASIFGATDAIGTRSFSRESYFKDGSIPDWSNLRYNSVYNNERQG